MQQVLLVEKLREDQNTIYHAYVRGLKGLSLFSMGFKMNWIPFVKLRSNCVTLWKLEKNKYEASFAQFICYKRFTPRVLFNLCLSKYVNKCGSTVCEDKLGHQA